MIIFDKDSKSYLKRIVLIPNRSINWSLLVRFYVFICGVSITIATVLTFLGYWMVLPFYGLEMLALGAGLYATCRKIYQQEVIVISNDIIRIEKGAHRVDKSWEFNKYWVRITLENKGSISKSLYLMIGSHGNYVEVGSSLTKSEKESLAIELNDVIIPHGFLRRVEK